MLYSFIWDWLLSGCGARVWLCFFPVYIYSAKFNCKPQEGYLIQVIPGDLSNLSCSFPMKDRKYAVASVSSTCFPLWYLKQALNAYPWNTTGLSGFILGEGKISFQKQCILSAGSLESFGFLYPWMSSSANETAQEQIEIQNPAETNTSSCLLLIG